tara:strand:- start:177 stop:533 length:357 start_codon:yes stop_codon:yes gene_type:complete
MTTTTTIADLISAQFEDDGSVLEAGDITIAEICAEGSVETHQRGDVTFYVFADMSIIMVAGDAWDVIDVLLDVAGDVYREVETARIDVHACWQDSHGDTVAVMDTDGDLRTLHGHVYA